MNKDIEGKYTLDDFLIVMVLYRIDLEDAPSFKSLSDCNKEELIIDMVVYDNSPVSADSPDVFTKKGFHIQYISDPTNPGISKAYNTGVSLARKLKKKWILFLDQDTTLDKNLLHLFLANCNEQRDEVIFATTLYGTDKNLISPSRYFFKRGFTLSKIPKGKCKLKRKRPINSTVLVSMEVFDKVGGYNEAIRLDFSDHEFFDRVNQHFKHMFVVPSKSFHSLSSSDDTNIEGIKIRFGIFCEGARIAGKSSFLNSLKYFIVCALRGLKLNLKYRTLFFMNTLFKEWLK